MVATNLKAETLALMNQRTTIEGQMNVIIDRLIGHGGPGITRSLVDLEGFPRADIDIPSVLSDRHQLARLRNDYQNITNRIEQNLQVLHSVKLSPSAPSDPGASATTASSPSSILEGVPFAVIDEIVEGSPAASDGLQLGDLVVKFGDVAVGVDLLPRLSSEAQSNQGKPVPVAIVRRGSPLTLTVMPRQWHGQGLLGCHFRIL